MIDDALAALAMKNIERILQRNTKIINENHKILSQWIDDEPLIDWIPAKAGSVAFLKYHLDIPSEEFSLNLLKEKSTFLVPGSCFKMEGYLRIGFGNNTKKLKEGLTRLSEFLDTLR